MAKNGVFSRLRRLEKGDGLDDFSACSDSHHEVHVLAVDDSLVDRKVIERLLKITSCKGEKNGFFLEFYCRILCGTKLWFQCWQFGYVAVTAVDSGMRALQFLGLDEEETSVGFDVS